MAQAKKKKRFFDVEIPIIQKSTDLLAFDLEELEGKFIKYDLSRILRGKGMEIQFKISVKGDKAIAIPRKSKILHYYIARAVRKGTNYVEDSFEANTMDAKVRIKPFLVTRRKVARSVRTALRNKAKEEILKYCEKNTAQQFFEDMLDNKLQKILSMKLKKIYPLSFCEIRIFEIKGNLELKKPAKEDREKIKEVKEEKTTLKSVPSEGGKDTKKTTKKKVTKKE
jgi:ribosomal protein S3AE